MYIIARVPPCPSSVTPGLLVPVPKFSGVSDCTGDPDRNIETSLDVSINTCTYIYLYVPVVWPHNWTKTSWKSALTNLRTKKHTDLGHPQT